jgi:hypothetical protein
MSGSFIEGEVWRAGHIRTTQCDGCRSVQKGAFSVRNMAHRMIVAYSPGAPLQGLESPEIKMARAGAIQARGFLRIIKGFADKRLVTFV